MADQLELSSSAEFTAPHASAPQNPAVARCAQAWQRTYELTSLLPKKERLRKDYDSFINDQAKKAFLDLMPPLAGYQNIQEHVACIGYALLHGIFLNSECEDLLKCAKFALAALRAQPRSETGASA